MTERYLTEEEVGKLLCASKDKMSDEQDMSFDDEGEYDKVLPDPVISSLGSDEENEVNGVTVDLGVESRNGSECWASVLIASNRGRITVKILFIKSQDQQDLLLEGPTQLWIALNFS